VVGKSPSAACPPASRGEPSVCPITAFSPNRSTGVGSSFRKAGAANYVSAALRSDGVKLLGPPRDRPRRSWLGPEWQALELLAGLPDDAGAEAVWRALSR